MRIRLPYQLPLIWIVLSAPALAQETPSSPMTLTFFQAIEQASSRHVQAIVANKRVLQAMDQLHQAESYLYPQLDGTMSQSRRTVNLKAQGIPLPGNPLIGPFNTFDARVKLTQTLFDSSMVARLHEMQKNRDLSLARQRKADQDAMALVATLFVNALRAEKSRDLAQALVRRDEMLAQLAQLQENQGTASSLERQQAQAAVANSHSLLQAAQSNVAEKLLDLSAALGLPADPPIVLANSQAESEAWGPFADDVLEKWIDKSPEVDVARRALDVSRAEHQATKRESYPRVTASADYGASGETPKGSLGTYSVGGQLAVPIFSGGQRKARTAEALHTSEELEASLQDTVLHTEAQAKSANNELRKAWEQKEARRADREVTTKERALAEHRAETGIGSESDVFQAKAAEAAAEDQFQEAQAYYTTAQINLAHALSQMDQLAAQRKSL